MGAPQGGSRVVGMQASLKCLTNIGLKFIMRNIPTLQNMSKSRMQNPTRNLILKENHVRQSERESSPFFFPESLKEKTTKMLTNFLETF